VLAIPTVKREHQSYLSVTLKSIFDSLSEEEEREALVVVFVAETDPDFVASTADELSKQFPKAIESGLLEVVAPPAAFYPPWDSLRRTLGDDPVRVQWRSKQNLDYAYLMM